MRNADERQTQNLLSSFDFLTSPKQMCETFKVMAVVGGGSQRKDVPPGFVPSS